MLTCTSSPAHYTVVVDTAIAFGVLVCAGIFFGLILLGGAAYFHYGLQAQKRIDSAVVVNYYAMLASSKGGRRGDRTWVVHKGTARKFVQVESSTEDSSSCAEFSYGMEVCVCVCVCVC